MKAHDEAQRPCRYIQHGTLSSPVLPHRRARAGAHGSRAKAHSAQTHDPSTTRPAHWPQQAHAHYRRKLRTKGATLAPPWASRTRLTSKTKAHSAQTHDPSPTRPAHWPQQTHAHYRRKLRAKVQPWLRLRRPGHKAAAPTRLRRARRPKLAHAHVPSPNSGKTAPDAQT